MLNNEDLNQVTWEQRVMEGDPKFEASQDIPERALSQVRGTDRPARASMSTTRERSALRGTRRWPADRPVVIEVKTDPDVPPLAAAYHAGAGAAFPVFARKR